MKIQVECYSGYKADERPVRFRMGERVYEVKELVDQWYGQDGDYFKVRADDGNVYILKHHPGPDDSWTLASFSREKKTH